MRLRAVLAAAMLAASLAAGAQQLKPAPSGLPPEQEEQLLHSERFKRLVTPALKYTDYCIINELMLKCFYRNTNLICRC